MNKQVYLSYFAVGAIGAAGAFAIFLWPFFTFTTFLTATFAGAKVVAVVSAALAIETEPRQRTAASSTANFFISFTSFVNSWLFNQAVQL